MPSSHDALDLGPLTLGGNVFGWTADRDASFAVLDAWLEAGGRSIDTADMYPQWVDGRSIGDSERIIGAWVADRGVRDQVVIATKVGQGDGREGLAPDNVRRALEESLERLQTDRVDLYYAHVDDDAVPQEEYVAAFGALVAEGKALHLGASNFAPARLRSAVAIAAEAGVTPFTVSQDRWNLLAREIEAELVPTLAELGISESPYSALASGFLTGKYTPGATVDSPRAGTAAGYAEKPGADRVLAAQREIAQAHGVTPTAVALAWLRAQPVVSAPIASARSVEQLPALVEALTLELGADEVAALTV
ncbi:aryl-alcohol dehydrogenase-like predicted oxidoreductase [Nocardioides zeae]|uniref:Aryl-alcohol dehydrogenase-like predicted oxidoreductase n=2 Tax=Nocardioides zeae TaxID=1457234 RepID=A0ACC6IEU9_9ACTN|nr:aldo/keto reductase [Nocardioides zeae]MDQ1106001.1 aryl-alcohol dehydrogenase-like predicted oxidoreductase [Nocardioides zeae]MDR6174352.1 aryl-alcohol dehydrogenase-like predicted oxidoreductase [Nocardioides zeae]MDR6209157.1 aryl-alcohol dehydrogenase-like predicted oxidoreductase [Nocardioides zeae]